MSFPVLLSGKGNDKHYYMLLFGPRENITEIRDIIVDENILSTIDWCERKYGLHVSCLGDMKVSRVK